MAIKNYVFGPFQTNCYVITKGTKAIIIDPGVDSNIKLNEDLKEYEVLAILITHAHIDHIDGIGSFKCPVYISEADKPGLKDTIISLYADYDGRPSYNYNLLDIHTFKDDEDLIIGDFKFHTILTPGHTLGSTCFLYKDVVFTGDTLFRCSVGRTDFYGGSESDLNKSLEKLLKILPEDIKIYSGHDDVTDLKFEKKYNPFLKRILNK